jgi:hypothetical protein
MEKNHPERSRTARSASWSFRAPLLLAAALICLITGLNVARLVQSRAPRNPWEASEVMEAWRSLRGLPVYDPAPDGHATHFYGPLGPWVQGELFRWVGPNNHSGRFLTLISALATVTLIAACVRSKGSFLVPILVWAMLFGLNHRSGQYFIELRPDMTAMFFACAAIALMGLGLEQGRGWLVGLGTASLIVGFLFKQPAVVFAAVPAVALVLRGRRPSRAEVLLALVPLGAAIGVIVAVKTFWPTVYHYTIEVPGSFWINWRLAPLRAWEMLQQSPLFLVLVGEWLLVDGGSTRADRRTPWVVAVLAIAFPFGAIAYAKALGAANSVLPALLAMTAFCALRLPGALARLEQGAASIRARALLGSFTAMLLLMNVFPPSRLRETPPPWDGQYDKVIEAAARLPGTVVCPEDPTIPLYAKEHAGRGLFPELDSHTEGGRWPRAIPDGIDKEIRAADFVVDIRRHGDYSDNWFLDNYLDEPTLRGLGFEPDDGRLSDTPSYRIWRRRPPGDAPGATRTAWNAADGPPRNRASQE